MLVGLYPLGGSSIDIHPNARWQQNGITVAEGNREDNGTNQLSSPWDLYVDDDQTIYVADTANHRIVEWKWGATSGQVVAGGNGQGSGDHQLSSPLDMIVDKESDSLIISDYANRRVVRWSRRNGTSGETIISNINCLGLTMDENGSLYVVDTGKDEVRRYRRGESQGIVVAGGNGGENHLDQLSSPRYMEGAKQGIVVAGGQGKGDGLTQLSSPQGVVVDPLGTVYVADWGNDRIMRWPQGATQGSVIVGGNGKGGQSNQLNWPIGLSFDRDGNLYVVDLGNDRVQKFNIESNNTLNVSRKTTVNVNDIATTQNYVIIPRSYQTELVEQAKDENLIVCLPTGSGKTYIAVMLIKEMARETLALVQQQSDYIRIHTDLTVGNYYGALGVDSWSKEQWLDEFENHQVLVFTAQVFLNLVEHNYFPLYNVNLLIFDECQHSTGGSCYPALMKRYNECHDPPRILGLTASISAKKLAPHQLPNAVQQIEQTYKARVASGSNREESNRYGTSVRLEPICCLTYQDQIRNDQESIKIPFETIQSIVDDLKSYLSEQKAEREKIEQDLVEVILMTDYLGENLTEYSARSVDYTIFLQSEYVNLPRLKYYLENLLYTGYELGIYGFFLACKALQRTLKSSRALELITDEKGKALSSVGSTAMTARYQRQTIKAFRAGEINVLVATAVVEEGLDIPKCNLVFRFNRPPNFSSYMQSKGRARAKQNASYMLQEEFSIDNDDDFNTDDLNQLEPYRTENGAVISAIRAAQIIYQ
ncbi:unnamed protein product [Rotaria sp. Silwood1]|nr:unnamed protein product [Rotaria sp. Silwood1]